jgi:hypothetical protein
MPLQTQFAFAQSAHTVAAKLLLFNIHSSTSWATNLCALQWHIVNLLLTQLGEHCKQYVTEMCYLQNVRKTLLFTQAKISIHFCLWPVTHVINYSDKLKSLIIICIDAALQLNEN